MSKPILTPIEQTFLAAALVKSANLSAIVDQAKNYLSTPEGHRAAIGGAGGMVGGGILGLLMSGQVSPTILAALTGGAAGAAGGHYLPQLQGMGSDLLSKLKGKPVAQGSPEEGAAAQQNLMASLMPEIPDYTGANQAVMLPGSNMPAGFPAEMGAK